MTHPTRALGASDPGAPESVTGHRPPYTDAVVIPAHVERSIRRDCTMAARDMLGPGYVTDYYQQTGADFEMVALAAYRQGVRDERDVQARARCAHEDVTASGAMQCRDCGHVFPENPS